MLKHWKALFAVVTTAVVVLAAVVTPTAASAAANGAGGDSTGSPRMAKAAASAVQILTPGAVNQVVLTSKTKAGIATAIVCYVSSWGPASDGFRVRFELFISCQGGVPIQLNANMDMFWIYLGEWQQVPGSANYCGEVNFASLACSSIGPCFQAGNYYDGLADLRAIDELGVTHSAVVYAPPRFVSCTV